MKQRFAIGDKARIIHTRGWPKRWYGLVVDIMDARPDQFSADGWYYDVEVPKEGRHGLYGYRLESICIMEKR